MEYFSNFEDYYNAVCDILRDNGSNVIPDREIIHCDWENNLDPEDSALFIDN